MTIASMLEILVYMIFVTQVMADEVDISDDDLSLIDRAFVTVADTYEYYTYPRYWCGTYQFTLIEEDRQTYRHFLPNNDAVMKIEICGNACSAFGEPHYSTFDHRVYSYQGTCAYVQAMTYRTAHTSFSVININKKAYRDNFSYVLNTIVNVYGYRIKLDYYSASINGVNVPLDSSKIYFWQHGKWVAIFRMGNSVALATDFGLYVGMDLQNHRSDVIIPTIYQNQMRGMCGNYDNNMNNDFIMRNEQLTTDIKEFGASWKEEEFSTSGCADIGVTRREAVCSDQEHAAAVSKCGFFRSAGFTECNSLLDPAVYETTCVFDVCAVPEHTIFKCSHYRAYAEECSWTLGRAIDWRQFVPDCGVSCPANSRFVIEYDPCFENTCATPLASARCSTGNFRKTEGCLCNSGYVREDNKCIEESKCGCIDDEGTYHKIGDSWTDCSSVTCTCNAKNTISCSCHGLSACSHSRASTALCLCGGDSCPRICKLDSNGVVKHQSTTHPALTNSMKHVIVETLVLGDNPCKMNVQVRMDKFAVNFIGVNFGAWPNKPSEYAFNAAFNLWDSTGVTIRGFKLATTTYKNTAPPAWTDGLARVLITRVSANVWKLEASCYGHKMAEVNFNASSQPLGVIDVKYPDMFGGTCYA